MKKTIVAMIAIGCLVVISLSTFALSHIQAPESMKAWNEKNATDTTNWSAAEQITGFSNQQASKSYVTENGDSVDGSCRTQGEQTLNKNESTIWPAETNQSPVSDLPVPLPDGRLFLHASAGTEDPIPYIPTQNPKVISGTPIVPPELDS